MIRDPPRHGNDGEGRLLGRQATDTAKLLRPNATAPAAPNQQQE